MLRTNLASRPFYNVRAVRAVLTVLVVLALAVTAFNIVQAVRLTNLERALGTDAGGGEAEAARLQAEAADLRARVDPAAFERLSAAVEEANAILDRRTFSWTALLAHVEATLPREVRITRIQPREQRGRAFVVVIDLESYDVRGVSRFMQALEQTEAFRDVRSHRYTPADGVIRGNIEALYLPPPVRAATVGQGPPAEQSARAARQEGGAGRE